MGNTPVAPPPRGRTPGTPGIPPPRRPQQTRQGGAGGGGTTSGASDSRNINAPNLNHKHVLESRNSHDEFKCSGCGQESRGERYRCTSNCDKVFHKECKTFKETVDGHEHTHVLRSHKKIFKCDGCKEEGFGKRFRCDQCGHELHTLCKFPKKPGYVNWLTQLPFEFHTEAKKSETKLVCGACTNDIDGYFYHCSNYVTSPGTENGLYLHPCCFNLSHILFAKLDTVKDGDPPTNENELKYTICYEVEYGIKCFLCKHWRLRRQHSGLSYVCDKKDVCYHVYCVWKVVHEAWITANGHDIDDMSKTLEIVASKQLAKSTNSSSSSSLWRHAGKILLMILKMVASTLMGDPTFGIVHLFGILLNN